MIHISIRTHDRCRIRSGILYPEYRQSQRGLLVLLWILLLFGLFGCTKSGHDDTQAGNEPRMRPAMWSADQRLFPHGEADSDAYRQALSSVNDMRTAGKVEQQVDWEFAGPTNIGGRVVDIEIDPGDPTVAYAASATGGVWKSTDRGVSWLPVFEDIAVMTIGDLALSPSEPGVIYVGTGEANGGHNNFAGGGVYKSTDGGETWTYSGLAETVTIGRIVVDPSNPRRIFVAATGSYFAPHPDRGIYLSEDAGATWQRVLAVSDDCGGIDVALHPGNSAVIYAAMWQRVRSYNQSMLGGDRSAIYVSRDGGISWGRLGTENGLPDGVSGDPVGRIGLAVSPAQPDAVWALYNDGRNLIGLYKSEDVAETWERLDQGSDLLPGTGGFSWYFGQIRVHPRNPDLIWVLDVGLMKSSDGGASWDIKRGSEPGLHVDFHAMAFGVKDSTFVLSGHDGGISISEDTGESWRSVDGLPLTQFYEIAIDPHNAASLYGGTQDNGTVRTLSGDAGNWHQIYGGDGFYVTVDPDDGNVIYAEAQFGALVKSVDGGRTFVGISPDIPDRKTNWSTPVVLDPVNSSVIYYGSNRLFRSENGGMTWVAVSPDLSSGYIESPRLGTITAIAIARSNPSVILVGTDDGNVWLTSDRAETWISVSEGLPFRWVTRVGFDPNDANRAYITFSGLKWRDSQSHVFRTQDRGTTWEDVSNGLPDAPVNALAIDPVKSSWIYIGTDVGAFVSNDFGNTWQILGANLPAVSVYDLKIHAPAGVLVAGTHGRSMYRMSLEPLHLSIPEPDFSFSALSSYPNPFSRQTTIEFMMPEAGHVKIDVVDMGGSVVSTLLDASVSLGSHTIRWDGVTAAGVPAHSGVYICRILNTLKEDVPQFVKMVLLR